MSDRLNTVLEDGRLEQLRIMAGGQRKVGAYLSDVIAWLWYHREQLQTAPLSDFAPILQEWIPRFTPLTPEEQAQQAEETARLNAELGQWRQRMDDLQRQVDSMQAIAQATLEASAVLSEDAKAAIRQSLIQQGLLVPQQDSSQNDT